MKLLKKVSALEVKRAFVTAQNIKLARAKGKKYLPKLERKEYLKKVVEAKSKVRKFTEKQLDAFISDEYKKRLVAYDGADWYRAKASVSELGVWRRAGGLPAKWTCCPLRETAEFVRKGMAINSKQIKARSKRAIPRIMDLKDIILKEACLYPIVFQNKTGTCGRKYCRTNVKGDIDDGCMRSIALAVFGIKTLNIYFGKPKKA